MKPVRLRATIFFILGLLAYFGAQAWRPTLHLSDTRPKLELESLFPKSFDDWTVDDRMPVQLVSPDTQALLSKIYNQTLSRTYINSSGDRVMLSVAYGGDQSDGTRAHRPEVCYPAQGFQVTNETKTSLALAGNRLGVRRLVAKLGGRVEPITYWVIVGEKIALSGTEQKIAQLSYSIRGLIPDGMLVRVSTIDSNAVNAFALQDEFIKKLAEATIPPRSAMVFGGGST